MIPIEFMAKLSLQWNGLVFTPMIPIELMAKFFTALL